MAQFNKEVWDMWQCRDVFGHGLELLVPGLLYPLWRNYQTCWHGRVKAVEELHEPANLGYGWVAVILRGVPIILCKGIDP